MKKLLISIFAFFLLLTNVGGANAETLNLQGPGEFWFEYDELSSIRSSRATFSGDGLGMKIISYNNLLSVTGDYGFTSSGNVGASYSDKARFFKIYIPGNVTMTSLLLYSAGAGAGDILTYKSISYDPFDFKPDSVTQIVATPISDTAIRVNWLEPDNLDNYDGVEISRAGGNTLKLDRGTTEILFTGLNEETRYTFNIKSFNSAHDIISSNQTFFATTLSRGDIPPEEIRNLQSFVYNDRVKFAWENPADVLHHEVRIYRDGYQIATAVTPANSFTDYDLSEHTTYTFVFYTVRTDATRSEGISVTETTKGKPRGKIQGLWAEPGDGQVEVSFHAHLEATEGYALYLNGVRALIPGTSRTLTGLENAHEYTIQVAAVNEWGESERSDPFKVTPEEPIIPEKPKVRVSVTNDSIKLNWDRVAHAQIYKVYEQGEEGQFIVAETTDLFYTSYNLAPGESKTFFVSAANLIGESEKTKITAKTTETIEFGENSFGNVMDAIKTGFSFLGRFGSYLLVVLGVLFAPTLISIPIWLFNRLSPSKKQAQQPKKQRAALSAEEKERRARERKLNKVRDDKYEYLTRSGRTSERDSWVKSSGYIRPHERQERAREERNQKAREQRAEASKSEGRGQRTSRGGRLARNGR